MSKEDAQVIAIIVIVIGALYFSAKHGLI